MKCSYLFLLFFIPSLLWADDSILTEVDFEQENSYLNDQNDLNESELRPFYYSSENNTSKTWMALNLSYTFGRSLGYQKGYVSFGGLIFPEFPSCQSNHFFFDAKGLFFDHDKWGGSLGFGSRCYLSDKWILGLNAYYDYRLFRDCDFNQLGLGFELLGSCTEFRINGYIPVGKKTFNHFCFFEYPDGGYWASRQERIYAWYGIDAEMGSWLIPSSYCNGFGLYVAAGSYYYWRQHPHDFCHDKKHHTVGGRARLLATVGDFLKLSTTATYDATWNTRIEGKVEVAFPLDYIYSLFNRVCVTPCSSCFLDPIFTQPIYRHDPIVVSKSCNWTWNWGSGNTNSGVN
jgi:hypothetical protein